MSDRNTISIKQYDWTEHSNTTSACVELRHFIPSTIDQKKLVSTIFIDLQKAFDAVNHALLVKKLGNIGLSINYVFFYSKLPT